MRPIDRAIIQIDLDLFTQQLLTFIPKDRKMKRMVMSPKSDGVLYPMDQIPADKMRLPTFVWFDYIRPQNKDDIFEWRGKKAGETLRKSTRKPLNSPKRELINMK